MSKREIYDVVFCLFNGVMCLKMMNYVICKDNNVKFKTKFENDVVVATFGVDTIENESRQDPEKWTISMSP